jgi:hypothetical protein
MVHPRAPKRVESRGNRAPLLAYAPYIRLVLPVTE